MLQHWVTVSWVETKRSTWSKTIGVVLWATMSVVTRTFYCKRKWVERQRFTRWIGEANWPPATKNSSWSNGWSDFILGNMEAVLSILLVSRECLQWFDANLQTHFLSETGTMYEDEYWSTGWNTHIYTLPNGDDFLLRYYQLNANVRLAPLGAGTIGSDIYNSTWGSSYLILPVFKVQRVPVIARNSSGDLVSYQAQRQWLVEFCGYNDHIIIQLDEYDIVQS